MLLLSAKSSKDCAEGESDSPPCGLDFEVLRRAEEVSFTSPRSYDLLLCLEDNSADL